VNGVPRSLTKTKGDDGLSRWRRRSARSSSPQRRLADRLFSRGVTKMISEPEQQGDLRLAANVLRALVRSFNHADIVTIENGI
jgi:hypothetical protein